MMNWLIDLALWRMQTSGIRRRHRRDLANLEARLRAEFGQAPSPAGTPQSAPAPATAPVIRLHRQPHRLHLHLARWLDCAVVLLVMLLVLAFLVYLGV